MSVMYNFQFYTYDLFPFAYISCMLIYISFTWFIKSLSSTMKSYAVVVYCPLYNTVVNLWKTSFILEGNERHGSNFGLLHILAMGGQEMRIWRQTNCTKEVQLIITTEALKTTDTPDQPFHLDLKNIYTYNK